MILYENEIRKITDSLYDTANKIVGNIGESTTNALSVTCEDYVTFAINFTDKNTISPVCAEWIQAYKMFAKYNMDGFAKVYNGESLTIYWRTRPEIIDNGRGRYTLYARLLISYAPKAKILSL